MITKKDYKILRVLNNSSIIIESYMTEKILMGKGIGFGFKPGDVLPKGTSYDKSYKLLSKAHEFQRIINGYDDKIVYMVMDTIQQIMVHNSSEFTTNDLVTLADHLAAMFLRISKGEAVISFFAQETKTLYPQSFKKAQQITDIIFERYEVYIPEAEIAYIALYIQNLLSTKSKQEVEMMNSIIVRLNELLEEYESLRIDKDSVAYSRFLIHIHMLLGSSQFNKAPLNSAINNAILNSYPKYTEISKKILAMLEDESKLKLSEAEISYIVIHLINLFEPKNNEGTNTL